MRIMERYKIFLWRYWIAICVVLVCASCSDDDKELQEYLTPVSGSETIFDQGFSFDENASSQSVSFETGQSWKATLTGVSDGWCTINPASGGAGTNTITVSVGKNETQAARVPLPNQN